MTRSHVRGSWPLAFGMLGLLPPYCGTHGPRGGQGGASGSGGDAAAQAGAGASGSGGDAAAEAGAGAASAEGGQAGEAGTKLPDLVNEPLLGCPTDSSGALEPGRFEVLPPPLGLDPPSSDYPWITDWSGDGRTAVGYYTTPADDTADNATFVRWTSGVGYSIESRVRIELAGFREPPLSLTSCDGSRLALRLGQGDLALDGLDPLEPNFEAHFHDYLTLSEDGSSVTFLTGVRDITRPATEWHSTRAPVASLLFDPVQSISWDGLTTFGTSGCFITSCTPPAVFRWRPWADGGVDVTTEAPSPIVAADGESVVYNFFGRFIGIWRSTGTQSLDCDEPCDAIAWSAQAQVLLVLTENGYRLWTSQHGFRPLESLLTVPAGFQLFPTHLSLDGWTIAGTATTDGVTYPYFRATLKADAFK